MTDNTGILSPDVKNLAVGKGFLIFKPDGETDFFHLGNVPSFAFTPSVEKIEHYSSQEGTKTLDDTIVTLKKGQVKITMEEFSKRNLGLMLMGAINDDDPDNIIIDVFANAAIQGELRFYATNEVGPRWRLFLNRVRFTPSGDFSPISEGLANMQITGDVYAVSGSWGTAILVSGADPVNITLPFITGTVAEDEIVEVSNGGWIDVDDYTYQWKAGGVDIAGATSKDFTVTVTQHGAILTCAVTGHNDVGTATALSVATTPVTT